MAHYIAEIVIPPTEDIANSVAEVMKSFERENPGDSQPCDWWDWYIIGGRFSGHKTEARIGEEKLKAFIDAITERKVTCAALQCGKQELLPESQIPMVDALWREMVPGHGDKCILFAHARDQYRKDGVYSDDVCRVADVPAALKCDRLIIAGKDYSDETKLKGCEMLADSWWNGCTHQKTDFDGVVATGLHRLKEEIRHDGPLFSNDWLVVTVDYHD